MYRRLRIHAIALLGIGVVVLGWDPVGMSLPAMDAILAPGGAAPGALLLAVGALGARLLAIAVLPGLTATILVDAALVVLWRRGRREPAPVDAG